MSIRKVTYEAFLSSYTRFFIAEYLSFYLHERHVRRQLMHIIESAPIDVLEREIVQQILEGMDAEFVAKDFGTLWPHSMQVFNISTDSQSYYVCPSPSGGEVFCISKIGRRGNLDILTIALDQMNTMA